MLSLLFRLGSLAGEVGPSSVTMTPLRFSTSDSRSCSRDKVEDIEGNVACVYTERDALMLADGGRDLGVGGDPGGTTDARGDDGGVDIPEIDDCGVDGREDVVGTSNSGSVGRGCF